MPVPENETCESPDPDTRARRILVIGGGSCAFAAAIRATERGARVTLVESGTMGGCCVNTGCVPSKIMIRAAAMAEYQRSHPFTGVSKREPSVSKALLAAQQTMKVEELRTAKYERILAANDNIEWMEGHAAFRSDRVVSITTGDGQVRELQPDRILIATGSEPVIPHVEGLDAVPYWTSTEALFATELPPRLVVIGSSVIAVELAQAFRRLGSKVTMVARRTLLTREDPALGAGLETVFTSEGINVLRHTQVRAVSRTGGRFRLDLEGPGHSRELECDQLLIATGRSASTGGLGLENTGIHVNEEGAIITDDRCRTTVPHVYAAGDCTDMPQHVYVAAAAGTRAGENMTGGDVRLDLSVMPAVIFTDPQVATAGLTEAEAVRQGLSTVSRTLTLDHVPRALANFDTRGFIKIVAESGSGRILGVQTLAAEGGELIQSAAIALRNAMSVEDLAGQLFPYLTMVEGLKICAQTFRKDI